MTEEFLMWMMAAACVVSMLLIVINTGILASWSRRKKE